MEENIQQVIEPPEINPDLLLNYGALQTFLDGSSLFSTLKISKITLDKNGILLFALDSLSGDRSKSVKRLEIRDCKLANINWIMNAFPNLEELLLKNVEIKELHRLLLDSQDMPILKLKKFAYKTDREDCYQIGTILEQFKNFDKKIEILLDFRSFKTLYFLTEVLSNPGTIEISVSTKTTHKFAKALVRWADILLKSSIHLRHRQGKHLIPGDFCITFQKTEVFHFNVWKVVNNIQTKAIQNPDKWNATESILFFLIKIIIYRTDDGRGWGGYPDKVDIDSFKDLIKKEFTNVPNLYKPLELAIQDRIEQERRMKRRR